MTTSQSPVQWLQPDRARHHVTRAVGEGALSGRGRARVLQVVWSLTPGGAEFLVLELCRRLAPEFIPAVCCLENEGDLAEQLRAEGVEVIALHRRDGFRPELGRQIAAVVRQREIDILHCHQYSPFVYGRIAQYWNRSVRLVYTEHGRLSDAAPSWKRRIVNPLLARFDGPIVAVSDELRHYMNEAWFPPSRVRTIVNGIDAGRPPSPQARAHARGLLGLSSHTFVVATVARLDPVKDLSTLLDAFSIARRHVPHSVLVIVGDGPERLALERQARRADLEGAVLFLGFRSDVKTLLPGADVYVNSSISEGVSLTILEAMASGVPVVATMTGGTPEVLADGAAGVLVPVRHSGRLADALLMLAADPVRRSALAIAGRRRVESSFTLQRMVNEYARLYRQLLDG